MSRCTNYIGNLPPELLTQVFDYLDHKDYLQSMLVCTRWYEILSDHRYMVHHRLRLQPRHLNEPNFSNLKRFYSVSIRDDCFAKIKHEQKLQKYLFNGEAVEMLEELQIVLNVNVWNNIFGTDKELVLPNLHTLRVSVPMVSNETVQMPRRIVAPKLKKIHQDSNTICEPLDLFRDKIEKLVVDFPKKGHFHSITLGLPLMNLRSLTLKTESLWWFCETDFHSGHKAVFSRLDHLKFDGLKGSLTYVCSLLIGEAKNLKSLELYGYKMKNNAISQINRLKHLRELVLMIRCIEYAGTQVGLSLPNLIKLTTSARSLAPLDSVPRLRSLTIASNERDTKGFNAYRAEFIKAQFRVIAGQLESLNVIKVELDAFSINQICTLVNLKSLKLIEIEMDSAGIFEILSSLKNLKYIRFTDCSLADHIIYCDVEGIYGFKVGPGTERYDSFFAKFSEENADCAIVAEGGHVMDCLTKYDYLL